MEMMVLVMMLFSLIVSCLVLFSSIVTVLISPSLSLRIFSPMCLLSFCCQFVSVRSSCSVCVSCLEFPALYSVCAGFCFVFPRFVVFPSACQLFIKTRSLFHHLLAWGLHFGLFFFCYNLTVLERHQHESQSHDITTA